MAENNYSREKNRYGFNENFLTEFDDTGFGWSNTHMSSVPQQTAAPSQQSIITDTVPEIIPNPGTGKLGTEPGGKSNAIDVSQQALTKGTTPLNQGVVTTGMPGSGAPGTHYEDAFGTGSQASFDPIAKSGPIIEDEMMQYEMAQDKAYAEAVMAKRSEQGLVDLDKIDFSIPANPTHYGQGDYTGLTKGGGQGSVVGSMGELSADNHMTDFAGPSGKWGGEQVAEASLGQKAGSLLGKAAPWLTMGSQAVNSIREYGQRADNIGSLEDSISELSGMIGGMPNEKDAGLDALSDKFSERRRRIGEGRKLALGQKLEAAREKKTGGLISGSKKELVDDITDAYQTSADLDLAGAEDQFNEQRTSFIEGQREKRADATRQLDALNEELKQQKKDQFWAPLDAVTDLAITGLTIVNPAAGMAVGAAKSGIKSAYA